MYSQAEGGDFGEPLVFGNVRLGHDSSQFVEGVVQNVHAVALTDCGAVSKQLALVAQAVL